jgi:hypothetical protein
MKTTIGNAFPKYRAEKSATVIKSVLPIFYSHAFGVTTDMSSQISNGTNVTTNNNATQHQTNSNDQSQDQTNATKRRSIMSNNTKALVANAFKFCMQKFTSPIEGCSYCGEKGHLRKTCPKAKIPPKDRDKKDECDFCGKSGRHMTRACFHLRWKSDLLKAAQAAPTDPTVAQCPLERVCDFKCNAHANGKCPWPLHTNPRSKNHNKARKVLKAQANLVKGQDQPAQAARRFVEQRIEESTVEGVTVATLSAIKEEDNDTPRPANQTLGIF